MTSDSAHDAALARLEYPIPDPAALPRLAYSVPEAAHMIGIGRTKLREVVASGKIAALRIDRRLLVPHSSIEAYIDRKLAEARRKSGGGAG
jgi:excisionase family DNA binding protein